MNILRAKWLFNIYTKHEYDNKVEFFYCFFVSILFEESNYFNKKWRSEVQAMSLNDFDRLLN